MKVLVILIVGMLIGGSISFGMALMLYFPQINELKTKLNDFESQYETLSRQYETLSQENNDLLMRYEELQSSNNDLLMRYEELQSSNNDLLMRYEELQSSYDILLSKYERLMGSLPLSPEPTSNETIDKEYKWEYNGYTWTLSLTIPESLYEYYKKKDRLPSEDYSVYATHLYDDEYIRTTIEKFNFIAIDKGYTETEKVNLVIAFVQSLPYTSDEVTTPFDEYPRYPLETLVDGGGDCEDTSILAAALIEKLNYDVVLVDLPGHMAVGVHIEGAYGSYYTYDNKKYFFIETTGEGWSVGEIPPEYEGESAYLYPLTPIPIITHNWTSTLEESKLTLTVNVENVGSAMATEIRVYAAFDAGEGQVWNPEESEAFDLNFDREVTIQLILDWPKDKYTRLIVGILNSEGYFLDESHSEWFQS